jgi:hypothetical protein
MTQHRSDNRVATASNTGEDLIDGQTTPDEESAIPLLASPPTLPPGPIDEEDLRSLYRKIGVRDVDKMSRDNLREVGINIAQGIFGEFPWTGGIRLTEPDLMASRWVRRFSILPTDILKPGGKKLSREVLEQIAETFDSGMMGPVFDDDDYPESVRPFVSSRPQSFKGHASRRWRLPTPPANPPHTLNLSTECLFEGKLASIIRQDYMILAHHSWGPWTGGEAETIIPGNGRKKYDICRFNIMGLDT